VLRKGVILAIVFLLVSGITSFSFFVSGEESIIPDWVKNNARWWADGQIAESDFISAMEYLINQGIIQIQTPVPEVIATKVSLTDDERAQSFVVHYFGGDYFAGETVTIYTYSSFYHFSQSIQTNTVASTSQFGIAPQFILRSLPSEDKKPIYDLINKYVKAGAKPTPFDVSVDVVAGNGKIIQIWHYRNCLITDYATYLDQNKETYRFSDTDDAEIRDLTVLLCGGYNLEI